MYQELEIVYVGLLILAVVAITTVSVIVLLRLFRGQR